MQCKKCGAEMEEGALFCPKCGEKQNAEEKQDAGEKPALSKGKKIGIAAAGGVALAAIAAAVILLPGGGGSGSKEPDAENNLSAEADIDFISEKEEQPEAELPEEPLYHIEDVAVIDIGAVNHTPGTKAAGMKWDSSLFYWLEDADTASSEDGNIARCRLTRTLLRDAQTGALIQYEIYSDPDTGSIYKIVSVEETGSGLNLTDWYYLNGQPNFVFQREDSVYTPTYATISKVGERYYFDNNVMVKWRMIRTPGEVGEYTLTPGDTWYSQGDYYAESDELRQIYDDTELRMLNAACNTYDAVINGGNIGMMQGFVRDTAGSGIAGKRIKIYRGEDNVLLYEADTDDTGMFSLFVYLDDTSCYLKVESDGQYKETEVQGLRLTPASLTYACDMTLHKESGDEYPVTLRVYPAADVRDDGAGNQTADLVQAAEAVIREGAGNYTGESFRRVETQNGELAVNLPSGVYTVQVRSEGYPDAYTEIEVWEEAAVGSVYMMPALAEGQTGILLTWEGDADLDLTLFTPWQAADGDMAHIGGNVSSDSHGNMLVSDNKSGCEVMYVNSAEVGSYKLYVNNYTDSLAGNYASGLLSDLKVRVCLYNNQGFVAEYTLPLGQNGVVWEVAEINGGAVTSAQRVYSEITGKKWWTEDKDKSVLHTKLTVKEDPRAVGSCEYEEYDEEGKIIRKESYEGESRDGSLWWYKLYEYDEYGNLLKETDYNGDGTPIQRQMHEYTYVDGRMTNSEQWTMGWYEEGQEWGPGSMGIGTVYDEKGRIVMEFTDASAFYTFYSESEETISQFVNDLLNTGCDSLGNYPIYVYLNICDENGNILREEYVNMEEKTRSISRNYGYDSAGRLLWIENNNGFRYESYDYDQEGRLLSDICRTTEGARSSYIKYNYDERGNLIQKEHINNALYCYTTDYFYDARGRCIREETVQYEWGEGENDVIWWDTVRNAFNSGDTGYEEGLRAWFEHIGVSEHTGTGKKIRVEYTYY
ncbi:MAG: zinc-ribbon domain-containing protein [Butyrivibrio sp.]|nr:zinc-ribbon domain-containing protein [Acetatifactor muris]MCM1559754.1 zinc-ribbon domain-containing protein [Butyrivibrio sp.]